MPTCTQEKTEAELLAAANSMLQVSIPALKRAEKKPTPEVRKTRWMLQHPCLAIMDILLRTHDSQTHSALGAAQNAAMHEGYRN